MSTAESNTEGSSVSILLSFKVPGNPSTFQKLNIGLKRFFTRRLVPVGFRCEPFVTKTSSINISTVNIVYT